MGKNDLYVVDKNIEKLYNRGYSDFVTPKVLKEIKYRLKKNEYNIFELYESSDKVILYRNVLPKVFLFEIECYDVLKHSQILGSLFGLNISEEFFGDIVIWNGHYYVYFLEEVVDFVLNNFKMVGNCKIGLREVDLDFLSDYKHNYEEYEVVVSSLRIDSIIARIVGISRDKVKDKIRNKEVFLNYDILKNNSYFIRDGDIFSVRRYGKFKFLGISKMTKKDNYIIRYVRFI